MNMQLLLIEETNTLIEAMAKLDESAKKILFVTKEGRFVAALTDGDIRRWILKKGSLDAHVKDFANYSAAYLYVHEQHKAHDLMKKLSIDVMPIIDNQHHIVNAVFIDDTSMEVRGGLTAPVVIMAGGMGTRLYPFTKILPKPLIPIGDEPIIEHIINRFNQKGCKDFHLIVNHKKNMIKAYFNEVDRDYNVSYADEDKPLGTGGGLCLLKNKVKDTFFLSNCDILIDEDYEKIYEFHKAHNNLITMVCSLKNVKIPYGVVEITDTGEISEMKEKPSFSFFTNTGFYVVEPQVIDELNDNEKIGFPDIIEKYRALNKRIGIYPISENSWMDMGQLDEMEKMKKGLKIYE